MTAAQSAIKKARKHVRPKQKRIMFGESVATSFLRKKGTLGEKNSAGSPQTLHKPGRRTKERVRRSREKKKSSRGRGKDKK